MNIHETTTLIELYGRDTTLEDLIKMIHRDMVCECPTCHGTGQQKILHNVFASGLPDTDYVERWKGRVKECEQCKGKGCLMKR